MGAPQQRDIESQLIDFVQSCVYDPVKFAETVYPWGEPGTPLENFSGPLPWQKEALRFIAAELKKKENGLEDGPVRLARATGHGVGKSAFSVWVTQWYLATRKNARVAITANTEKQLRNVTWSELAIWHERFLLKHWFQWRGTDYAHVTNPAAWRAFQATWSEANPEGFQGLHGRNLMVIMDEASGIPRSVWEAARGATTTSGNVHIALGNPTRPEGEFYDIFHKRNHRWNVAHIDSRTVVNPDQKENIANLSYLNELIEDFGEDSDFCRVRIRGLFPTQAANQFISTQAIEDAMDRVSEFQVYSNYPVVLGVDPSHYGDDYTAVVVRQGPKVHRIHKMGKGSVIEVARFVETIYRTTDPTPEAIFVDRTGGGQGVVDVLMDTKRMPVWGVAAAGRADEPSKYVNTRAELYFRMRDAIERNIDLPEEARDLCDQLRAIEFMYDRARGRLQLIPKEQMRSRGLPSPDDADALALTFFMPSLSQPGVFDDLDDMNDGGGTRGSWNEGADPITGY